ncbi:hypothetical protein EWI07_10920 [Sporolactobacillus sp. THM7-4]|nr:hypothetical protein EWI07_10920 [Sporolactobacillus sp. THM7-4]
MKKKQFFVLLPLFAALTAVVLFAFHYFYMAARQSITYFPEDMNSHYTTASTRLYLSPDGNMLNWLVRSRISHRSYLRQDFSLLYKNNRLFTMINYWRRGEVELFQKKVFKTEPGYFQSLSLHHSELHYGETILGKDASSEDHLIVQGQQEHFTSFKTAESLEEKEWLDQYNDKIADERSGVIRKAVAAYGIRLSDYQVFSLADLVTAPGRVLSSFNKKTARRITSQLWEGIYKTFLRGIQTSSGRVESAQGSRMPILLVAGDHLLIIIETEDHQIALLKQSFQIR